MHTCTCTSIVMNCLLFRGFTVLLYLTHVHIRNVHMYMYMFPFLSLSLSLSRFHYQLIDSVNPSRTVLVSCKSNDSDIVAQGATEDLENTINEVDTYYKYTYTVNLGTFKLVYTVHAYIYMYVSLLSI